MGYSCTKAADDRLAMIMSRSDSNSANTWEKGDGFVYFYEIDQEREDGAITGHVYRILKDGGCRVTGGFRINPNGDVNSFPHLNERMREACTGPINIVGQRKPVI